MELESIAHLELLALFARVVDELRRRELCRSANNPVADLAELLVARALQLTLASNSTAGYDAHDAGGERYQIKARRQSGSKAPPHFGAIRNIAHGNFDYLVAVLFTPDFTVAKAAVLPRAAVEQLAVFNEHQNGHVLALKNAWASSESRDITERVQAAWGLIPGIVDELRTPS